MEISQQLAVLAAIGFFALGLLGGIWKYAAIRRSPSAQAPAYVDIFHRTTLLYAFACALLERMVELGDLPIWLEVCALAGLIGFFAFAVFGYALHGWLNDTDNQLRRPYRLGLADDRARQHGRADHRRARRLRAARVRRAACAVNDHSSNSTHLPSIIRSCGR